jgi:hypothetical protein
MKDTINTLKGLITNFRDNIENTLINILKQHNITEIDCCGFSDRPIIVNDIDTFALDGIELCNVKGNEYILFNGCGLYETYYIPLKSMDIEYLIAVYEWVLENQEELFDECDE